MIPKIAIVGRSNVGKSSLLNLLARRRISIVDPVAGVTRDRVGATVEIPAATAGNPPHFAELFDTGGYGIDTDEQVPRLTADIERQIARAVNDADLILFVVDAQAGVLTLDESVARLLRTEAAGKPVILVANKVDAESLEPGGYESTRLGIGDPVLLSATTGYRKQSLYDRIRDQIDFDSVDAVSAAPPDRGLLLALVGKRNVGKSTLVNALVGDERVIVSELAGTTRDSVDVRFEVDGHAFTAIDTAGARKRKSVKNDIDFYSLHRSLRSVRRADVCLLLIDAAEPVSQVDRHLANEILRHHRPTVVVVNKWDLAERNHTDQDYAAYLDREIKGLRFAPIALVSARNRDGLREMLGMAMNLHEQASHRVTTSPLNQVVAEIMAERGPSTRGGKPPKIYYATQTAVDPPTIVLQVNVKDLFDHNYQAFLLNRFRDKLPFSEVPIRLVIRGD